MKKIVLWLLLLSGTAQAQQAVSNTGNLVVHAGGSLSVYGNFSNASAASLLNNGNLYLKSAVTNNQASMGGGAGTVYLNGTASQTVAGSAPFKVYNFVSDNASGVLLDVNLSVGGLHTFSQGLITTSATPAYLIYENGASYTGDGDTRHVNGWVKRTGASDFIFPVGSASFERTIAVTNLSASSEFNARYYTITPNTGQMLSPLVSIDPYEYWDLDQVAGGTGKVLLNWNHAKVSFVKWSLAAIQVAGVTGADWTARGGVASGDVTATGFITSGTVSSFGRFTFGSQSYPLPLDLINFTVNRSSGISYVKWNTMNEVNVDHFTVQRSDKGLNFYSIGQVAARNSGATETYHLDDTKGITEVAYYRLQSVDKDGKEKFSAVVPVKESVPSLLTLLQNPVQHSIGLLAAASLQGNFQYTLNGLNGTLIQSGTLEIRGAGIQTILLDKDLSATLYLLTISKGNQKFEYKIYKQ
jgi:hypothetical protein